MMNRQKKILIVAVAAVALLGGTTVGIMKCRKSQEIDLKLSVNSINVPLYDTVVIAPATNIESMNEEEIRTLYTDGSVLPWSSESDFSSYTIFDSMSVSDDFDTNIQLALGKEYEVDESTTTYYYYQYVTSDGDILLIPKSEDVSYIERDDIAHYNTTTADCVEAMYRLRMYKKAKLDGFKILDYGIVENRGAVVVTYYTAIPDDENIVVTKVVETVSKGNGEVTIDSQIICTMAK